MRNIINIVKDKGTDDQEAINVETNSFILLYLRDGKAKIEGDIELKDVAPMLMKYVAERMAR